MCALTNFYKNALSDFNPTESDGVLSFTHNGNTINVFVKSGWFIGLSVGNGFGVVELKKRISQKEVHRTVKRKIMASA